MTNRDLYETLFLKIVLEDDHKAFEKLFFEFYPSLCVFAGRYISSSDVCEDIVQEVFFNIWKNRKSLKIHSSFRNFLVTSVKNSCTDHIRKQYSHNKYLENRSSATIAPSPMDVYTSNELQEMLQRALDKLPPNICTAFTLSRNKQMTYKEIATEMEVSQKTVESYISQALKTLREELKDYLPLLLLLTFFK